MIEERRIPGMSKGFLFGVSACFAILIGAIFGQAVMHSYITLDDIQLIYFNPAAKGPTLDHLKLAFTTFDPELYIPLTLVSYQMEYLVAGPSPALTHAVNILLHLFNAVLVVWLATLLSGKKWIGVVTGLLFAIHPLNTEAIAWAAARKDVLSTFFALASFVSYLSWRHDGKNWLYALSITLFIFGLLSKVMILTLPVFFLLADWLMQRNITKGMILEKLPYLAFSILFGVIALFGKRDVIESLTPGATVLMAFKSTWFYLEKLVIPTKLAIMYPQTTPILLSSAEFYMPVVFVTVLLVTAIVSLRYTRIGGFAAAFFLLGVLPTFINFSKAGDVYFASDRYAYVPAIGLFFLVAWILNFIIESKGNWREKEKSRTLTQTLLGVVLIMFSITAFKQMKTWYDSATLFEHNVTVYPNTPAAHFNLGAIKLEQGDTAGAIAAFKASIALRDRANAHSGLASAYKKDGDMASAIREYEEARKIDADDAEPIFGLANLYSETGKTTLAKQAYEEALKIDPNYVAAYNNYGVLLMTDGDLTKAEEMFKKSYDINPSFSKTSFNLGVLYQTERKAELSTEWLERARALQPDDVDTLVNLAANYVFLKNPTKAVDMLRAIATLDPENAEAKAILQEMVRLKMVK